MVEQYDTSYQFEIGAAQSPFTKRGNSLVVNDITLQPVRETYARASESDQPNVSAAYWTTWVIYLFVQQHTS